MIKKINCPKCNKGLINLNENGKGWISKFWCDECNIDFEIKENRKIYLNGLAPEKIRPITGNVTNNIELEYDYDERDNIVGVKNNTDGSKQSIEYDDNDNIIYIKDHTTGLESWFEYDDKNRLIHSKNTNNQEWFYKYDKDGTCIECRNFEELKI